MLLKMKVLTALAQNKSAALVTIIAECINNKP